MNKLLTKDFLGSKHYQCVVFFFKNLKLNAQMVGKAGRRIIKIPRFEVLVEGRPWLPRNQNGPAAGLLAGWVFLKRKISPKILKILVLSIYCFGLTPDSDMMYLLYY